MKCLVCGGPVTMNAKGEFVCEYCGARYASDGAPGNSSSAPENEQVLFDQALQELENGSYDEAYYAFDAWLKKHPENGEAWWGRFLSKYGVLYETETVGSVTVRKPTLNRLGTDPVLNDEAYINAVKYSPSGKAAEYKADAEKIAEIQRQYLNLAAREKPYDVFISFKAQDDKTGETTKDSSVAYEIYERLNSLGNLHVFFSRITLQELHGGEEYEPYIYSALNTAKVLILVGSDRGNVEARWVKNEWKRFLSRFGRDSSLSVIPVLCGMQAQDLPEEIPTSNLVVYNGDESLAAITEGVLNLTGKGMVTDAVSEQQALALLLDNMRKASADGNFDLVRTLSAEVFDIDVQSAEAYYYLLLAEYKVTKASALADIDEDWTTGRNYKYAMRFADEALKKRLDAVLERRRMRMEDERKEAFAAAEAERRDTVLEENLRKVKDLMAGKRFEEARNILISQAYNHPDAEKMLEKCNKSIEITELLKNKKTFYVDELKRKKPALLAKLKNQAGIMAEKSEPLVDTKMALLIAVLSFASSYLFYSVTESGGVKAIVLYLAALALGSAPAMSLLVGKIILGLGAVNLIPLLLSVRTDVFTEIMFGVELIMTISFVVTAVKASSYNSEWKKYEKIFNGELVPFENETWSAIWKEYEPVLGGAFVESLQPEALPGEADKLKELLKSKGV